MDKGQVLVVMKMAPPFKTKPQVLLLLVQGRVVRRSELSDNERQGSSDLKGTPRSWRIVRGVSSAGKCRAWQFLQVPSPGEISQVREPGRITDSFPGLRSVLGGGTLVL